MSNLFTNIKRAIFGPTTIEICKVSNPCPVCESLECIGEVHLDSEGTAEILDIKCPKCGPVKRLYHGRRNRPEPRFEREFWNWRVGEFNKKALTPKREV